MERGSTPESTPEGLFIQHPSIPSGRRDGGRRIIEVHNESPTWRSKSQQKLLPIQDGHPLLKQGNHEDRTDSNDSWNY